MIRLYHVVNVKDIKDEKFNPIEGTSYLYYKPRIPYNFFTKHGYEDDKTPRVCFCPSISQALMALSRNIEGEKFGVYYIDINENNHILKKPTPGEVPDSIITDEYWILKPVLMRFLMEIEVTKMLDKSYSYEYGEGNIGELYDVKWKTL